MRTLGNIGNTVDTIEQMFYNNIISKGAILLLLAIGIATNNYDNGGKYAQDTTL